MSDLIKNSDLGLSQENRLNRRVIRALKRLAGVNAVNELYEKSVRGKGALAFVQSVLGELGIELSARMDTAPAPVPAEGAVVVVCNLSSGILDGLLALKSVLEVRDDVKIIAPEIVKTVPELSDVVIAGQNEGVVCAKKIAIVREIFAHVQSGGALILFAAQGVRNPRAEFQHKGEPTWSLQRLKLLRRLGAPLMPMVVMSQATSRYRYLARFNKQMALTRTLLELLAKKDSTQRVVYGKVISPAFLKSIKSEENLQLLLKANMRLLSLVAYEDEAEQRGIEYVLSLKKPVTKYSPVVPSRQGYSIYCLSAADVQIQRKIYPEDSEPVIETYDSHGEVLLCWDDKRATPVAFTTIAQGSQIIEQYGFEGLELYRNFEISSRSLSFIQGVFEVGELIPLSVRASALVPQRLLWEEVLRRFEGAQSCTHMLSTVHISDSSSEATRQLIIDMVLGNFYDSQYSNFVTPRRAVGKRRLEIFAPRALEAVGGREFLSLMVRNADNSKSPLSEGLKRFVRHQGKIINMGLDRSAAGGNMLVGVGLLAKSELKKADSKQVK